MYSFIIGRIRGAYISWNSVTRQSGVEVSNWMESGSVVINVLQAKLTKPNFCENCLTYDLRMKHHYAQYDDTVAMKRT